MGIAFDAKEGFTIITPIDEVDFKSITQGLKNAGFTCITRDGRNGRNFIWKKDNLLLSEIEIIFDKIAHETTVYRKNSNGVNEKLTHEQIREALNTSVREMCDRDAVNPSYSADLENLQDSLPSFISTEQEVLNRLALSMATKSVSQAEQSMLRTAKNLLPILKTLAELVQSKGITKFNVDHFDFLNILEYGISTWLKQSYEEGRENGNS